MTAVTDHPGCSLRHDAFFYGDDDEFVAGLVPPIERALAEHAPVLAVVPPSKADLLGAALGPAGGDVEFVDAGEWYRQPHVTVAAYRDVFDHLGSGAEPLVIGEVAFGDDELDWAGWTRYEAALNRVLEHERAHVVCPYDTRNLHHSVVADARRTHPNIFDPHGRQANADYVEPEHLLPKLPPAARVPERPPDTHVDVSAAVRDARLAFGATARSAGVPADQVEGLTAAVNEIVTNAVVHGGGEACLRIWSEGEGRLTCAVEDRGPGLDDHLLGYLPPPPQAVSGRGLWLARQLFPRSALMGSPGGGLTVVLATAP